MDNLERLEFDLKWPEATFRELLQAQEVGIAAALSGDKNMMADFAAGDPVIKELCGLPY